MDKPPIRRNLTGLFRGNLFQGTTIHETLARVVVAILRNKKDRVRVFVERKKKF